MRRRSREEAAGVSSRKCTTIDTARPHCRNRVVPSQSLRSACTMDSQSRRIIPFKSDGQTNLITQETTMNGRIVAGVLLTLIAVAVIVGIGATVYNAGMTQGLAQSGQLIERAPDGAAYPYYGRPFGDFRFFGLLVPLLL